MLPLGEMLGPLDPCVATRHGAPSSQADLMRPLSFWLIGIGFLSLSVIGYRDHSARKPPAFSSGTPVSSG